MKIEVEGSELVIKGLFEKRYPLCSDLHVDYEQETIYYKDKCVYSGKKRFHLDMMISKTFHLWESYRLTKQYLFEWRTSKGTRQCMEPIALSDIESCGKRIAEIIRVKAQEKAKEILGPEYEMQVKFLTEDTHMIAFYDVCRDGVPMCADDEEFADLLFEGYLDPDELHLVVEEIVLPLHVYPAQGIYEVGCLREDQIELDYFEGLFQEMKEKGIVSMEKYRYLEQKRRG